jgi:hypothetical protein
MAVAAIWASAEARRRPARSAVPMSSPPITAACWSNARIRPANWRGRDSVTHVSNRLRRELVGRRTTPRTISPRLTAARNRSVGRCSLIQARTRACGMARTNSLTTAVSRRKPRPFTGRSCGRESGRARSSGPRRSRASCGRNRPAHHRLRRPATKCGPDTRPQSLRMLTPGPQLRREATDQLDIHRGHRHLDPLRTKQGLPLPVARRARAGRSLDRCSHHHFLSTSVPGYVTGYRSWRQE